MKKITLFAAAAALVASSAVAAGPQVTKPVAKACTMQAQNRTASRADFTRELTVNPTLKKVQSRAEGDDVVTIDNSVDYVLSPNSFYSGYTTSFIYLINSCGLTGIRNSIGFNNLTQGAEAFSWKYGKVTGLTDDKTDYTYDYFTSDKRILYMGLTPLDIYSYPSLSATFGTDTETKNPDSSHSFYYCGRSMFDWGMDNLPEGADEPTSWSDFIGVTNCAATPSADAYPDFMVCRPGAANYSSEYFNENGVSTNWNAFSSASQTLSNMSIKSFATYIPPMPSSYQLDAMWLWFNSQAQKELSLTVNIYIVNEDGTVNYDKVAGTGELAIPAGSFACGRDKTGAINEMPVVEIAAVDEDGYAIDSPLCVTEGQDIFVCLEGLDNPDLLEFTAVAYNSTTFAANTDQETAEAMWPNRAFAIINTDLTAGGNTINRDVMLPAPYPYFAIDDKGNIDYNVLNFVTNFTWMFNVNFPVVMNPDQNSSDYQTANFNVEAPVAGGEISVPVACDYKLDVLLQEELAKGVSSPWLTYNVTFDEETGISTVDLTAEALPEGTPGREGYVVFMGYGIDFVIVVTQGDTSAIDSITVQPVAKGTQFFDLQGRRLSAAPAHGIYIQNVDGKATKHIAR